MSSVDLEVGSFSLLDRYDEDPTAFSKAAFTRGVSFNTNVVYCDSEGTIFNGELSDYIGSASDESSIADDTSSDDTETSAALYTDPLSPKRDDGNDENATLEVPKEEEKLDISIVEQVEYADAITEFEKTPLLCSKCYKTDVSLGATKMIMKLPTALFDTETGPSLIREDVSPPDTRKCIKTCKTFLRSASDTMFSVKGVIRLQVDTGRNVDSTLFGVGTILGRERIS